MAIVKAFKAFRPATELAEKVASRPYDVLNSAEAREEAKGNEHSFYYVIKPEIDLPEGTDLYSEAVYQTGRNNLDKFSDNGTLVQDDKPCIYAYRQIMNGHSQVGLVICSHIDDYFNDVIKKHEYTRPVKENDRIKHMETLSAHVGPVFITYPEVDAIDTIVAKATEAAPNQDFTSPDGVQHTVWVIDNVDTISQLEGLFANDVPFTYIADGHHRAASSAKVGGKLRDANTSHSGDEDYNYFLSVLFPANQLSIIDYNRVVKDTNGLSTDELIAKISENFSCEKVDSQLKPDENYDFGMYIDNTWYKLTAKESIIEKDDPIKVLDISVISDYILDPILGIKDQRTDNRIDFVGGIRGIGELEKRVDSGDMKVAFAIHPVSIQQLIDIADSGNVMPPKSTWFEPKLRSGLFTHKF